MESDKKIIVPLDGSDTSETVLPEVEKLATVLKATISLLGVADAQPSPNGDPMSCEMAAIREVVEISAG